ncbi:uncharacterized protein EV420DRAFT_1766608 [Desarmillaria tabescens]|uniref:F-box domain-containing protein n=1 Tax=Armillaria tabescens TaxID=1929756 RepID=A0AA39JX33_ARMTA|nr:uncharacterized protein EV420DRAFT_1766608 [Desarmillaria tabescens]KAK0450517.1 hypothetical protein EV420DRAFT_1766608 [Desarmillaria tabescens]
MSSQNLCPQCGYNSQKCLIKFHPVKLAGSRMSELLKSNCPPLDTERLQLEEFIGENRGFVASLQERVSQARAVLDELLEEERRVKDMIESCKTFIQPIRRIPEGVIHEIFSKFCDTKREGKDSLDKKFAPLVLSQVCRDWRNVAVSTSRLRSFITLDFDWYRDELACQYLLQTYLLRSGKHDITLSIHSNSDISRSHLISVLLLCAPRWTNLSLSIPYDSLHAFSAARGSVNRLNRLSIEFVGNVPGLSVRLAMSVFNTFEYAPLLRSFSLKGVLRGVEQMNLPWSQLTEYSGNDWTSGYIDILKRAQDMESASLQCHDDSEFEGMFPSLSHRRLRVLHVHEEEENLDIEDILSEGGIVHFLLHVEFPALESLKMTYVHPYNVQVPKSLLGSTARGLKSLSIDSPIILSSRAQADLLNLLRTTVSLSSFSMTWWSIHANPQGDGLFLWLNRNINPDVVPRLASLAVRFINREPYLSSSFVDMVQSRRYAAFVGTFFHNTGRDERGWALEGYV